MKRIMRIFIMLGIIITAMNYSLKSVSAAEGLCEFASGSNVNEHNYSIYAHVVRSYLHVCEDGTIMRVQLFYGENKNAEITYYSSDFNAISKKEVTIELPISGGFYAYNGHYYLLSGSRNKEESNSKAVFALTKYTTDWKKEGTAFLYGANTTVPFAAGTAKFAGIGKYIYVRTCHEMYTSADGLNHQANLTFSVDTENMTVPFSKPEVTYDSFGYCSHSFNQFIGIDGSTLFVADHGDAYPRSLVICKYNNDCSFGTLEFSGNWDSNFSSVDMLVIPGEVGDNTTKTSLGGLECSSTDYLIAGNSVDMSDYSNAKTRNVFVASIDKNSFASASPKLTYITNYNDSVTSANTPILVKIGMDRFILLWSESSWGRDIVDDSGNIAGTVYYTEINGRGEKVGKTYSMSGRLSDCHPIVVAGKILWYAWDDEITAFYEINISNIADTSVNIVKSGHDYQFEDLSPKGGKLKEKCAKCGEIRTLRVPTEIYIYLEKFSIDKEGKSKRSWIYNNDENGKEHYSYLYYNMSFEKGEELLISTYASEGSYMPEIEVSNPELVLIEGYDGDYSIKMLDQGDCRITIKQKYNDATAKTIDFKILGDKFTAGVYEFRILSKEDKKVSLIGFNDKTATKLIIPKTVKHKGKRYKVTAIGKEICYGNDNLVSLSIPKYVEEIGSGAFCFCSNLKKITIKSKILTRIDSNAFHFIDRQASINVPNKLIDTYYDLLVKSNIEWGVTCK